MFKGLSREAIRSVIDQIIWSYWPLWGAPLVTGVLVYLQGRPWDILFLMVLGALLMATMLLYFGSQWRAAQTTENKIRFGVPYVTKVIPDKNAVPAITAIQLGMTVDNIAQFPMEIVIEDIRTRIENRQPEHSHQRTTIPIEVKGQIFHRPSGINIKDLIAPNKILEGDFYCKIKYGRPGNPNREKEYAYAVLFKLDENMELAKPTYTYVSPKDYLEGKGRVEWKITDA